MENSFAGNQDKSDKFATRKRLLQTTLLNYKNNFILVVVMAQTLEDW